MKKTLPAILRATLAGAHTRQQLCRGGVALELETIDLLKSDAATLARVRRQLIQVMAGSYTTTTTPGGAVVGPEEYVDRVLDRATFDRYNSVVLAHDGAGPVGFTSSFVQRRRVRGREIEIIRVGAHIVPAVQSRGLAQTSFIILALRYARTRLWTDVPRYYLGLCLNPLAYRFIVRRAPRLYPSPGCPDDPMMAAICEAGFPSERRVGDLVPEPRAPRLSPQARASIEGTDDPLLRYYLARCPRYDEGYGLPIAAELGVGSFVSGVARHAWLALTTGRRRDP